MIHSAARFDAAYTSGEYGRSALPVDAYTTWGTPDRSAAETTFLVPSTLVVTVGWTSRSASPGSRCAATWNSTSGRTSATTDPSAGRSRTSACAYSAPAARGHPRVSPRLTLTSRRGRHAASWLIRTEPTHPVPPRDQDAPAFEPVRQIQAGHGQAPLPDRQEPRVLLVRAGAGGHQRVRELPQPAQFAFVQVLAPLRHGIAHRRDDGADALHPPTSVIAARGTTIRSCAHNELPPGARRETGLEPGPTATACQTSHSATAITR